MYDRSVIFIHDDDGFLIQLIEERFKHGRRAGFFYLDSVFPALSDKLILEIVKKRFIVFRTEICEIQMQDRILFKGIISAVDVEPSEEFPLPFKESMKSRAHETLAETAGPDNGVIVIGFVLYEIMNVPCLVDIDVVAFRPYVFK